MVTFRDETDRGTQLDVEAGYHLPPAGVEPKTILDLGCHAGLTILDYRRHFPEALIWGVEIDYDNYKAARENVGNDPLVKLFNCGVATWDGTCSYAGEASNAYQIVPNWPSIGMANCHTLDKLLDFTIDFAKFDIEGMESNIFQAGGEWPEKILRLKAELHDNYSVAEASWDLAELGYNTAPGELHPNSVYAWRPDVDINLKGIIPLVVQA